MYIEEFYWSDEKNRWLKLNREISFEEVIFYIAHDEYLLDVVENPNYPKQDMFVVEIDSYVYIVPFLETEDEIFLKTIFPSRKATQYYLSL
jgi:hypothetical protein